MCMESKPMGRPSYGSIAHLPGSKWSKADTGLTQGQVKILTEKCRPGDVIIVTEKIDGSCMAVGKKNGAIIPLTRSGYHAITSPFKQHNEMFVNWVKQNETRFDRLLNEGERVVGEWMVQAHGMRYSLIHEPFVAFDIMNGTHRLNYVIFKERVTIEGFVTPYLIHMGGPISIINSLLWFGYSRHGGQGMPEGIVYRVENNGKVDFLGKYVRPDFEPGKYLLNKADFAGEQVIYNDNYEKWIM